MKEKTKMFALAILATTRSIADNPQSRVLKDQILRSSSSVAANYRAACRAKSYRDFIYKLGVVEEEADETLFWLEILEESGIMRKEEVQVLMKENVEILAIVVASIKTAKSKI